MKKECFDFRSSLKAALATGEDRATQAGRVRSLGWHDHLLHCEACRWMLEGEQVLDELLDSLPVPALSDRQRDSLMRGLASNLKLEHWLTEADPFDAAPKGLVQRMQTAVRSASASGEREPSLDQPLAHLDHISVPEGLSERMLQALREHKESAAAGLEIRVPATARPRNRKPVLRHWLPVGLVAASLALFLWYLPGNRGLRELDPKDPVVSNADQGATDANLLALLDSLEVIEMVDELDSEEWALLDQYDSYGLYLLDDAQTVDGQSIDGQGRGESSR